MIEVDHLSKYYGPMTAIQDLSFRVDKEKSWVSGPQWRWENDDHAHSERLYAGHQWPRRGRRL